MAKKNTPDPRQLSLFDDFNNVMAELKAQNEKENNELSSLLYGNDRQPSTQTLEQKKINISTSNNMENSNARSTNGIIRNSTNNTNDRDNRRSIEPSVDKAITLQNTGQMGVEQSREVDTAGTGRNGNISTTPAKSTGIGGTDNAFGGIRRHESPRNEQVGDILDNGIEHRTVESSNYKITASDNLGKGGIKSKYQDNINAIKLLNSLRSSGAEFATPEEQQILAKYVGWGGIPQTFDNSNDTWNNEYNELKSLIKGDDYQNAKRSTQDAHFTSETIVNAMYKGLQRLGIENTTNTLNVLEPSAGIGNFIGLKPENLNASFHTVEQDAISADILKYLYPESQHYKGGFQNSSFGKGIFDLSIGNPPFGNQKLYDSDFPQLSNFSIHNYFISKSVDLLKDGGIGAYVVSRHFMDAENSSAREYISENAHFLGATRLPSNAFKENALADVTTDIVYFQKKTAFEKENNISKGHEWLSLGDKEVHDNQTGYEKTARINDYFIKNPNQILGEMEFVRGQFADELKCIDKNELNDLGLSISKSLEILPRNIFDHSIVSKEKEKSTNFIETEIINSDYYKNLKDESLIASKTHNLIFIKGKDKFLNPTIEEYKLKNEVAYYRIAGMIEIKDSLRKLLALEKNENSTNEELEVAREELNLKYDKFTKKYGFLSNNTNYNLFSDDPEATLLLSLETEYDKGISKEVAAKEGKEFTPPSVKKADIFTKRVLEYSTLATSAENSVDALMITLREKGKIDFDRISSLVNLPEEQIIVDLQKEKLIFLNPSTSEWEIKDKYLTGNVKEKLEIANKYAESNSKYQINVEALEQVIPLDIEPVDIGVRFGSSWVPPSDIKDFIDEKVSSIGYKSIDYIPDLGKWVAKVQIYDRTINNEIYGIPQYPADKIIEALLTKKSIKVEKATGQTDERGKPIMEVDQELTATAMQKAEEINNLFKDWIWEDDKRRERLARVYNDLFNTNIAPDYNGSHLDLVDASKSVNLRPHQKNAIWRSIQEGTALFDHVVGAGKTLAAIATAKESKRMGFINKPMIVVPNHLLYQWKDEFYKLYPDANILVAEKTDFLKDNRKKFFSKVATGNWDAVIVAHSSFGKIDMPRDIENEIIDENINSIVHAIEESKQTNGQSATIKQLEKQRERLIERQQKLLASSGTKDKNLDFSDLGVDALFIDEAHEFKNLGLVTSMNVSGLGNKAGAGKATDLEIKCRYLQRKNNGKGVYFLTGTPISNTIAEVYTMQKYLQYDVLKSKNLHHFDSWASTFGKITSNWELDATGVNYKLKSRFANFENVPELLSMYRTFADVVTKEDLDQQAKVENKPSLTPGIKGGKPINIIAERSPMQANYMDSIIERMENLPSDPRIDNPLKITNDARKAGLDYRLIDPSAPDFDGTKVNLSVDKVLEIWERSENDKGTQLIFCDLSTPKSSSTEKIIFEDNKIDDSTDNTTVPEDEVLDMDEILSNTSNSNFSVYHDIKEKLIKKGIPEEQIAFIHDAKNDTAKSKLFAKVNKGEIRVLLGSTSKMGAGTNVQQRLVAAHHLDAPWRPSDLEQRNGRIVRQGNELYKKNQYFEVEIYNYATKQTYDARMWQTIEYKAKGIEEFRKGDTLQRTIEDIQSEASNAAEMKAAASGNPLILMQVNLEAEKRKLEALSNQHNRSKHRSSDRLKYLHDTEKRFEENKSIYDNNKNLLTSNTVMIKENNKEKIKLEVRSNGRVLTTDNTEELKAMMILGAKSSIKDRSSSYDFGKYRGFDVKIKYAEKNHSDGFKFCFVNSNLNKEYTSENLMYNYGDKVSVSGLFQRFDNFLDKEFDNKFKRDKETYERELIERPNIEKALGQPFAMEDDLKLVRENNTAVLGELKRMQEDVNYKSEWQPKTIEEYKKEKQILMTNKNVIKQPKVER